MFGVIVGTAAALFFPFMSQAFVQSAEALYGIAGRGTFSRIAPLMSLAFGALTLLMVFFFYRRRDKELEALGKMGSAIAGVLAVLQYTILTAIFVRALGSGADAYSIIVLLTACIIAVIVTVSAPWALIRISMEITKLVGVASRTAAFVADGGATNRYKEDPMAKLKLTYFDFHGGRVGEPARLALSIGGIPFEDDRVQTSDWERRKADTPFGALPVLEVDGQVVAQSNAYKNCYVGKLADLYPSDPWQAALCDEPMEAVEDINTKIGATFFLSEACKESECCVGRSPIPSTSLGCNSGSSTWR